MRCALPLLLALVGGAARAEAPAPGAGERLYRQGLLASGRPVRGEREGGEGVEGLAAACETCHRKSGLGSWEGQTTIPPIAGGVLFQDSVRTPGQEELARLAAPVARRPAYTPAALARALREGVAPGGRRLGFLMPRYHLDDATLASLTAYLRTLSAGPTPGVDPDTLHFATIVTPDADPAARQGLLQVLRQFFADKNAGYRGESRPLRSGRGVMYRVQRRWQLHEWALTGPPEDWDRQLKAHLQATPVFAVVSGLGGRTWAPIHAFCERERLPCLLPSLELPVAAAERDFYSVYFSRGVLLEAALVARRIQAAAPRPGRVVQVFAPGDIGGDAAAALAAAAPGLTRVDRVLDGEAPAAALQAALREVRPTDALVLWLRPAQLEALPPPPPAAAVFVSGLMGALERAPLPPAWREVARMTYPVDLPEQRKVRMDFPLGWFNVRHLPVLDERVQTDAYLACAILAETVGHMQETFVRDYLVERLEALVSHRLVNGYYPRLGLAPGQRFASKGGYLVRFAGARGTGLAPEGGWQVP